MLFSTSIFLFFFLPFVLFVYHIFLRNRIKWQNFFLLVASLFFYAWGEPYFVLIMLISIFANWGFALLVNHFRENRNIKVILTLMLAFNLSIIFYFKYLVFFVNTLNSISNLNVTVPTIVLPIGISFFTFQSISYVIDVYRGHGVVQKNPLNVGLYIALFPQLIAGPIVRYETIAEQIKKRSVTFNDFSEGVERFILGLAKKVLIANNVALIADHCFSLSNNNLTAPLAWLGAISYTLQIYFDFSGYSDMAIGLGRMFGFQFLENFNYPYISKSISDFWRRWHISLGSWFRDYVYIPLGGNRVSRFRLYVNLFAVWFLTGLWHGANWTFIVWGLMFFVLLVFEKTFSLEKKNLYGFGHVYTLFFIILGWVCFRSESLSNALNFLKAMFCGKWNVSPLLNYYLSEYSFWLLIAILFSLPLKRLNSKILFSLFLCILFILSIIYIIKGSYNPFIYFNF